MLQGIFFFFHLVISFLIVVVVLLQRSKGGGLSGAFGGVGAGDAAFGGVGVTTFLHKATIYLAIGFMVTSLSLVYLTAINSSVDPSTGGGRPAGAEVELPVGNTPILPDEAAVAGDDSTATGADSIVPDSVGEIVPVAEDSAATSDDTTEGEAGEGGQ